jgi:hypothetical protein
MQVMSKSKTLVVIGALLIVAASVFVLGSVMRTRREAMMVIEELKELSLSSRPNDAFDAFQWKYGPSRFKHSEACTFHFCTYEVGISNNAIAKLHLAPYTEMKTWFTVDKGQLVLALVEYRIALKGPHSPVVHVQQGICAHGCGARFDVNPHGIDKQLWNGLVEVNPRATQTERDAALALNVNCFHRIGGCKDIADLLPAIWQRSGPDSIASRLVGLSQRLQESHGSPSPDDF